MKVAVPVTNGYVDGPGEGETVRIYEVNGNSVKLVEEYPNPALTKETARGLWMFEERLGERGHGFPGGGDWASGFQTPETEQRLNIRSGTNAG